MLIVVGLVYFFISPAASPLFPKCPFYMATGLLCPGCGAQRAVHSLLHLDFVSAWHYNAFLVLNIPIVALLGIAEYYRLRKPVFYAKIHQARFIWLYFIGVIVWSVMRNIC